MGAGRKPRETMSKEQPQLPITETAEFKAALEAQRKELMGLMEAQAERFREEIRALASQSQALLPPPPAAGLTDHRWAEVLAMEMSKLSEQGVGYAERIPADVLKRRMEARQRMFDLILKAKEEGRSASYRLVNKVLLADQLIDPYWIGSDKVARPTEIDWAGVPNEAMVPLNDTAKEIHAAFEESIGNYVAGSNPSLERILKVTKGGLVVRGAPSAAARDSLVTYDDDGLSIKHMGQSGYKTVHVLGTVHPPARRAI